MRFSIIVPTLNCRSIIAPCLQSVLEQAHSDFEVLVVDGGSTDGTAEFVRSLGDPRVRLLAAPGSSIYGAMNAGIEASSGDYLLFLGADDRLHGPDTLQLLAGHAAGEPDLIIGNAVMGGRPFYSRIDSDLAFDHTIHHQATLYRRKVIVKAGGFDEKFTLLADFHLNRRIIGNGANIAQVDQFVSACGDRGVSKRRRWRMRYERLRLISDWRLYLLFKLKRAMGFGRLARTA